MGVIILATGALVAAGGMLVIRRAANKRNWERAHRVTVNERKWNAQAFAGLAVVLAGLAVMLVP